MRKTGPTNELTKELIQNLRKEDSKGLWRRIADDLEKATRNRRVVNISRIARNTKENETIIVPGKVLGSGEIQHNITVAALSFSKTAKTQIETAKGKAITIQELLNKKIKPSEIKIIG
jgi:large subunit ribosomal protein L18e